MPKAPRWMNRLDRPGGRWVLGLAESVRWSRLDGRRCRVRHRSGFWTIERPDEGIVVSMKRRFDRPGKYRRTLEEIFLFEYCIQPGDVVVDVGSGTGDEVPLLARCVGPDGRVVAVEAHPRSFRALELTIALNRLDNVTAHWAAVSDRVGTVALTDTSSFLANTLLGARGEPTTDVPATTVDALLTEAGLTHIDFLKMNIEGAEAQAIHGMEGSMSVIRHFCISCHDFKADAGRGDDRMRTKAGVRQFLLDHSLVVSEQPVDSNRPWVGDYLYARHP